MGRSSRPRTARTVALVYVVAMIVGGLVMGVQGSSHVGPLLFWLSQPGLNFLYVFVLMPLTAVFGDLGGGGGDAGPFSLALSCGLGAVVNVLLVRAVVCLGRMVAADLPVCRKRRTPAR
ncbi:hypothetical protein OG257_08025 [Streptomyces sp. NBC_00683]|uniref:hypothetical protein n=1 Tax=Streptomyces sp. NBC_00683 TaxID=2903670 RepID=UPI002E363FA1|nr:hypothetical protein [Streptomyces sp. NBC_00683]